jgi:hypothetical protein
LTLRSITQNWGLLGCVACLLFSSSCAPQVATVEAPRTLRLENRSRTSVAEIRSKPCGTPVDAYERLGRFTLDAGNEIELEPFSGCRDLVAVDAAGTVLGRQDHLTLVSGTTWIIR